MREPSLQKSAALSALLHLSFLVLSVVLIKHTSTMVMPSPYTVSLVSPDNARRSGPPVSRAGEAQEKAMEPVKDSKTVIDANKKLSEQRVSDRLTELASKKKVERIVKLRSVISVKSSGVKSAAKTVAKEGGAGTPKGSLFDSYYAKITDEIRQEWVYPDMGKKDISSIVAVTIRRDGTITIHGIEKSSGDLLFDRSVLKAVTKASPVSPPPYEMEMGSGFSMIKTGKGRGRRQALYLCFYYSLFTTHYSLFPLRRRSTLTLRRLPQNCDRDLICRDLSEKKFPKSSGMTSPLPASLCTLIKHRI
jgi:colicin import membrane protein